MRQIEQLGAGQIANGQSKALPCSGLPIHSSSVLAIKLCVLILHDHDSHNFIKLINIAVENKIHILELPAHTSNLLQPSDRTVFGPF